MLERSSIEIVEALYMVTINDIAQSTGLSRSTVSAVLSGKTESIRISQTTSELIREAADRLGYHRNSLAYQMVTGTTNVIGFLSVDLGVSEYTGAILSGIMCESAGSGYYTKLFSYTRGQVEKTLADIIGQRPAGIIAFAVNQPDFESIFDRLAKFDIPLLSLQNLEINRGIFVITADADGVTAAVEHLYSLGHRKIGFFTNRKSMELKSPRNEGFLRGMTKHNLSESGVIPELLDTADQETLTRVVASKSYTAIVCDTDYNAMRVLQAAAKAGVKVPGELSVTGFADLAAVELCIPPLTTVRQPFTQWGMAAMRKLLSVINDKSKSYLTEKIVEKIETELIERESTAPAYPVN